MDFFTTNKLIADLALLPDDQRKQADNLLNQLSTQTDKARQAGQLSYDRDSLMGGAPVSLPVDATITLTTKQTEVTQAALVVAKELGIKLPEKSDLSFLQKIGPDVIKWLQQDNQHAVLLIAEPALALQAFAKDSGLAVPDSLLKHLTEVTQQAYKLTGAGVRFKSIKVTTPF